MSKRKNKGFSKLSPTGSGGLLGGKKNKAPKEEKQTQFSNSYLSVLAGISEGTIGGLVNGKQSIFIDDTPVGNSDNTDNFTGFSFDFRNGTADQTYMPGYADTIDSETNLGVEVKHNIPIVRQIINKNLDYIEFRLGFVLQEFPEKGGVLGSNITFRISIKEGNGAYYVATEQTVSGRFASLKETPYRFSVSNFGGTVDRFSIKVERLTPTDLNLDRISRQITFQSFVESTETKLSYPHTALVGLKFEASQFTSAPKVTFDVYGKSDVLIPSNATVTPDGGLNYDGVWNGTFYNPNTSISDPAWILWDLMTSRRYGLGNQIKTANLNRWSFLAISKYCNEYVPDGNGGLERRFLVAFVLEGKEDAYKVIETLRSVFRGFSFFFNGALSFAADMPGTPVMQFTQADVEDGMFSYARTGIKARHNVAVVTWIDPNDNYARAIETVEDSESIATTGRVIPIELSAFGALTRGQARRAGLSVLITEKLELETITFKSRAYAAYCMPGMIIKVADSKSADVRFGGLITGYAANYIDLDHPVTLEPGEVYTISVKVESGDIIEKFIANAAGVYTRIFTYEIVPSPPVIEGNWIIASQNIQSQLFRVLNRASIGGTNETMYEVTALQYNPGKYGSIDFDYPLEPRTTRITAPKVVTPPANVLGSFQTFIDDTTIPGTTTLSFLLTANWSAPYLNGTLDRFVTSYLVEYRSGADGNWQSTQSINGYYAEFPGLPQGTYYLRVASIDLNGNPSKWVETSGITLGAINTIADFRREESAIFATDF